MTITSKELRNELLTLIQSLKKKNPDITPTLWAKENDIQPQQISLFLNGGSPGLSIPNALGYKKVARYIKVKRK